jgi:hypothetical protein
MPDIPIIVANVKAILNGQRGSYLQPNWVQGRNDSGAFQSFNYEGTAEEVSAVAVIFDQANWTWTLTGLPAGRAKLEAHAGFPFNSAHGTSYTGETPENIWELDPNDVQKEILEADFPNGSLNLSSKASRAAVAELVKAETVVWWPAVGGGGTADANDKHYSFEDAAVASDDVIALPTIDFAPAYSLYLLMKAGVNAFPVEASVIRHTQLVSNQYEVQASFINVGRLISTGSMTSVESTPSGLLYSVPNTPTPSQFIETSGDLQYGWRKIRPSVTRLAQFKWRIVQNYQLGLWAVKLFGQVL